MLTRRQLLLCGAAGGTGLIATQAGLLRYGEMIAAAQVPGGTLDPNAIPKYTRPLVIPPAMPKTSSSLALDYYEIAVRQFTQEILPPTIVVNGRTWAYLNVERRRYRFRFLNGCNSRFLILKHDNALPSWQIGSEGGFLPSPVRLDQLLMAPAERADVIVDFSSVPAGRTITLLNLGPDAPFPGDPADPNTTGQVMQFRVKSAANADPSTPPHQLALPALTPYGAAAKTRRLSLNEHVDAADRPIAALLGTVNADGSGRSLMWDDRITESPRVGDTEVWELHNFTADAHPIHIHEVIVEVVNRQPFGGTARPPESWETGFKDTVIAHPGEITRVKPKFRRPALFVWHCHIVEHEDNEMMRPYFIRPRSLTRDVATPEEAAMEAAAADPPDV